MCDLGMALGLAMGAMQAAGTAQAENERIEANNKMLYDQAIAEQDMKARETIIEQRASQKEAHQAWLEAQRGKAFVKAKGEGMMGPTAGLQYAEQGRQGSLSIQNAKDRGESAQFNYTAGTYFDMKEANNRMAVNEAQRTSPMTLAATVIGSGLSYYGAFS